MNDLTFALPQLRKSPGSTFLAVLTLALGIGVNTAILKNPAYGNRVIQLRDGWIINY
jgi:hypothetical protein